MKAEFGKYILVGLLWLSHLFGISDLGELERKKWT